MERWIQHSPMTDPGRESFRFDRLPTDIGALCRIIQGVLVHSDWLPEYGLPEPRSPDTSRATLPVSQRMARIAGLDPGPLDVGRPPGARSIGTCRDYALLVCAMLRHLGTPARIRCGFAAYFDAGRWEDHWICETWMEPERRWRRVDAQIDGVLRQRLGIRFDTTDVPSAMFMTAGEAWRRCREESGDPAEFGHGFARGLWFIRVNVVRDHCALNRAETSAWDSWRRAIDVHRYVPEIDMVPTDELATRPEGPAMNRATPPWLA